MTESSAYWPDGYIRDLVAWAENHDSSDMAGLQDFLERNLDRAAQEVADGAIAALDDHLEDERLRTQEFESRLIRRWRPCLDLLDLLISHTLHVSEEADRAQRQDVVERQDHKFDALSRLQGRSAMVAQEVRVLLRSGFATGALARWRTLHEIWIVSSLLADADPDVSRRYLAHPQAERLRAQRDYEETWQSLGLQAPDWTPQERQQDQARLRNEFGPAFTADYGWAAPLFGGTAPKLRDLQKLASLDDWRLDYRDASHGTHANPTGIAWNLQGMGEVEVFSGPSNAGLFEPARGTLIALTGITIDFLGYCHDRLPEDDNALTAGASLLVDQKVSVKIRDAGIEALDEIAAEQYEQEARLVEHIEAIRSQLGGGPLEAQELARRLDVPDHEVQDAVERAEVRGLLRSERRYSIP